MTTPDVKSLAAAHSQSMPKYQTVTDRFFYLAATKNEYIGFPMRERRLTATTDRQAMIELSACRTNRTSIFKLTKSSFFGSGCLRRQRRSAQVKELPIEKPKERTTTEQVQVKTQPRQQTPTTGVLVVLLNPIVPGKVAVKNEAGRVLKEVDSDREGQAEFLLPRNKQYQVEASLPGTAAESPRPNAHRPDDCASPIERAIPRAAARQPPARR